MKSVLIASAFLALAASSASGPAAAEGVGLGPTKPVPLTFYSGRWYEIARTTNARQKDCEAPVYEFKGATNGVAPFVLTCRKGSPKGPLQSTNVDVKLPTDPMRNKFRASVMGGVLGADYLVLDRADDQSWAIMSMPGGKYVWILSRKPNLDAGLKAELLRRVRALGFDMGKIVQPRHG